MLARKDIGEDRRNQQIGALRFDLQNAVVSDQAIRRASGIAVANEPNQLRVNVGHEA